MAKRKHQIEKDYYQRKNHLVSKPRFSDHLSFRSFVGVLMAIGSILVLQYWKEDSLLPWGSSMLLIALACIYHPPIRRLEGYVCTVLLALTLSYVLFFRVIQDNLSEEVLPFIHIILVLLLACFGVILPIRRYIRTRRWAKQHNDKVAYEH